MWWQAPSDAYHSVIQPSLTVTVTVEYETVYSANSAGKFPEDFANFQKISKRKK